MTKENFKKFVKEHKYEIVLSCVCATALGIYSIVTAEERANRKMFYEQLKMATTGCTNYMTDCGENVGKFLNNDIVEDINGIKLKVNGVMFFGNNVEV